MKYLNQLRKLSLQPNFEKWHESGIDKLITSLCLRNTLSFEEEILAKRLFIRYLEWFSRTFTTSNDHEKFCKMLNDFGCI